MASKGVNKVILIGNLGRDPEVRHTQDGKSITNFSIATSESWMDKQGNKQEKTEWHKVSVFGKLAEIAEQYLDKGSQLYIEGKLQTRKWQDKDGNDKYTTEILGNEMNMLGGRQGSGGGAADVQSQPATPMSQPVESNISEEDIPF